MSDAAKRLADELQRLRREAGEPSSRKIAMAVGMSHTTVSESLKAAGRPSWPVVQKIAKHLGGEDERIRELWLAAAEPTAQPSTVAVPPDLLRAAAGEIAALSGHWTIGTTLEKDFAKHDKRAVDGSCCTCQLLSLLRYYAASED